ncbi:2-amino-4-oxopentanoate thiolase subunit OrtA [Clostridium grantii]|uniref:2-amino-4-ketopentanoate thiolase alpha subunit n=1 Tax=Clostridium grantii DSM 8605 TaxID=1121316 RepID=A0A1M5TR09_9CLOT|nr:2-amino-4-oxopentanoate thiolase subunit OrtA [Clostridium grantii]SHH53036.1 hypothetical protein SAMN02745207_01440 [Clostridium grantii DSM 8605]
MKAKKGDWVRIYNIVLKAEERGANLPEETKKVPLEMWDKGFLVDDAATLGNKVEVETIIGRHITGELVEVNPSFEINYGRCITETLYIGKKLREMLGD